MEYAFTDEQDQFRDVVRRFLGDKSPTTEVRRLMDTAEGYDAAVWQQLADDLALTGIHIPETYGGAGFGPVELCIAMEEQGRALLCAPYFSSCVLAAGAILHAAEDDQKANLLPAIASGQTRAALAVTEPNGRWDTSGIQAVATRTGNGWVIDGEQELRHRWLQRTAADRGCTHRGQHRRCRVVVLRGRPERGGRHSYRARHDGCNAQTGEDRLLSRPGGVVGQPGAGAEPLSRTLDLAAIALANEMVGGAQALLDSAVAYANIRVQFGRAIGSFQAIKHKCADMLLDVELAKSAAYYAAQAAAEGDPQTPGLARNGEGCCCGRIHAYCREHDSDPRRHRLHVG